MKNPARKREIFQAEIRAHREFRKLPGVKGWEGHRGSYVAPAESGKRIKRAPTLTELDGTRE